MIKSVHKAMEILSVLSDARNQPVRLCEIAEYINENKSTCAHIVKTLQEDGYIKQISRSKGYVLGPASYCLTRYGKYDDSLIELCRPLMRYVHKKTGAMVVLTVIQNETKYIIDYIDPENIFFSENFNINPDAIYRTVTGRLLLANMDESDIQKIFKKYGVPHPGHWNEVNSYELLLFELSKINKKGVLELCTPYRNNDYCIGYAAPIYKGNTCIAALGTASVCNENTVTNKEFIKSTLAKATKEINRRISFNI